MNSTNVTMDITTKVTEIAKSKNMSLKEFHNWLRQQTVGVNCCTETACVGKEFQVDTITFRMRGHCRVLVLEAKEGDSEYEVVNRDCGY